MSDSDEVFLASDKPLAEVAARAAEVLGLELMGEENGEYQYRARGRSFDGWIGVFIEANDYYPEPGEVQAMDLYPVRVDVQSRALKETQPEEARLAFELLSVGLPEVPALLSHNLEVLVAASRPGVGIHYFGENVWLDPPEVEPWRPWVLLADD
ncbi:hypothetical protein [Kribbella italica]|uniref:Uncharacterized protein n=1 Tax=Kribbella italica TaxID=1540520 RepID=A0A7W9MTZ2_9ACTN|nr:hypothetical protein [Kribbella italica]MBB5836281.1 hypothetical protein [Kribbella italica]